MQQRNCFDHILDRSAIVREGPYVIARVDVLMGHDGTASLVVDSFETNKYDVWDPAKVLIAFDHFCPPATVDRAGIQRRLLDFVLERKLPYALYQGICHQLLMEDARCAPGSVVIGADSHSTTVGALGTLAFGVGATDFECILRSGLVWMRRPDVMRIDFVGSLKPYLLGKDIVLHLASVLRRHDLSYVALEMHDLTSTRITMDSRATVCNMAVDIGAKAGLFVPDDETRRHCESHGQSFADLTPDPGASYVHRMQIDVGDIEPMVALPHDPRNVRRIRDLKERVPLNQIFMGSCTSGRNEDVAAVVRVVREFAPRSDLKKIFIPASNRVLLDMTRSGALAELITSGVTVPNSSCGPCCNIDKGLLADHELCASTSSRNFLGRMGSMKSSVYLVSTFTAAASMHTGELTGCDALLGDGQWRS